MCVCCSPRAVPLLLLLLALLLCWAGVAGGAAPPAEGFCPVEKTAGFIARRESSFHAGVGAVLECLRTPYGEMHVVSMKYSDVIFYSPQKWCPINHSKVRLLSVLLD